MAATLPIDAIGFILVPSRKRTVSYKQVSKMLEYVPNHIASVGVMQNPTIEEVEKAFETGLVMIQLHGTESPDFCKQIRERFEMPIIKVFTESNLSSIPQFAGVIDVVLLDHASGGVGIPIDWSVLPQAKQYVHQIDVPLWVAGGLNASNIVDLCTTFEVDGIDLSSGIEIDGIKNETKMKAVIERMEQYGRTIK